jgi:hypothetical protein
MSGMRSQNARSEIVVTWLASFQMRFRLIGGLPGFGHSQGSDALDVIDPGHFTWEYSLAEYAALVTRWWRGAASGTRR